MNLEQMKKIVDGAPEWAVAVNMNNGMYYSLREFSKGDILLASIRDQLAKREPMELRAVDIPHGTIVLEE